MAALDRAHANTTPAGAIAGWTFTAPSGTTISRASIDRYVGRAGAEWETYGQVDGGPRFDTCDFNPATTSGCSVGFPGGGGGSTVVLDGLSGRQLTYAIRCGDSSSSCANGGSFRSAWAVVYAARITLSDGSAPAAVLSALPTGWARGTITATASGTDNSGVQSTAIEGHGANLSNRTRSCDYRMPVPCTDEPGVEHAVDTRRLADGPVAITATATDAAGNVGRSEPVTINVDNHAPGAPQALQVVAGDGLRSSNGFDVTWTNPDQAPASPVARVHWRLCQGDECQPEQIVEGAATQLGGVVVPGVGDWTLRVWLEDAAGNVDGANAATAHLRYRVNPLEPSLGRLPAKLRGLGATRHGRRLVVSGRIAGDATGKVVVRVRRAAKRRVRPRVAKRASVSKGRFRASLKLPPALRHVRRLRISVSYPGDGQHAAQAVVRYVRLP